MGKILKALLKTIAVVLGISLLILLVDMFPFLAVVLMMICIIILIFFSFYNSEED